MVVFLKKNERLFLALGQSDSEINTENEEYHISGGK